MAAAGANEAGGSCTTRWRPAHDAGDLEPRDVGDFRQAVDRRIVVNVVSYIVDGTVQPVGRSKRLIPWNIQRGNCPDPCTADPQYSSSKPSTGHPYFSTWLEMINPRLKSRSVIQQLECRSRFCLSGCSADRRRCRRSRRPAALLPNTPACGPRLCALGFHALQGQGIGASRGPAGPPPAPVVPWH